MFRTAVAVIHAAMLICAVGCQHAGPRAGGSVSVGRQHLREAGRLALDAVPASARGEQWYGIIGVPATASDPTSYQVVMWKGQRAERRSDHVLIAQVLRASAVTDTFLVDEMLSRYQSDPQSLGFLLLALGDEPRLATPLLSAARRALLSTQHEVLTPCALFIVAKYGDLSDKVVVQNVGDAGVSELVKSMAAWTLSRLRAFSGEPGVRRGDSWMW